MNSDDDIVHEHGAGDADSQAPITGKRVSRRMGDIREAEQSSHVWLISFTDVMALMLTFFVLLFSMTEPAKQDWSEISSAMQNEFNKYYGATAHRGSQDAVNINKINFNQALNINYLAAVMETVIADSKFLKDLTLIPQQGALVISFPRDLLFDPGQATVKEDGARALYALGGALARVRNAIEITGHADPRPVGGGDFDSNWDLSMARAVNVSAVLESVGYQSDVTVHGYSSGRYADLEGVVDEEQRLDLARRVDIIVLDHDGAKQKVFSSSVSK